MKKVLSLVGLLLIVAMLSGCAGFDSSTDRSEDDYSSHSGHSHH